jgi:hypothetical protein
MKQVTVCVRGFQWKPHTKCWRGPCVWILGWLQAKLEWVGGKKLRAWVEVQRPWRESLQEVWVIGGFASIRTDHKKPVRIPVYRKNIASCSKSMMAELPMVNATVELQLWFFKEVPQDVLKRTGYFLLGSRVYARLIATSPRSPNSGIGATVNLEHIPCFNLSSCRFGR